MWRMSPLARSTLTRIGWLFLAGLMGLVGGVAPGRAEPPVDGRWTVGVVAHADSRGEILPCT
jgi:hypothetical protein